MAGAFKPRQSTGTPRLAPGIFTRRPRQGRAQTRCAIGCLVAERRRYRRRASQLRQSADTALPLLGPPQRRRLHWRKLSPAGRADRESKFWETQRRSQPACAQCQQLGCEARACDVYREGGISWRQRLRHLRAAPSDPTGMGSMVTQPLGAASRMTLSASDPLWDRFPLNIIPSPPILSTVLGCSLPMNIRPHEIVASSGDPPCPALRHRRV